MKRVVPVLLLLMVTTLTVHAQGVFNNQTNAALQRVIEDYPNQFKNIKGDLLQESTGAADYQSKVQIPGALNCVISVVTQPSAISNWTCSVFASADYDKARQRYQQLYDQISNTIIRIKGQKPFILNGSFNTPDQDSKSTATRFNMTPAPECVQHLKIEINLRFRDEWEVTLSVYE